MPDFHGIVSVAGSSEASPSESVYAERLGILLATAGYAVACGGGGGVMEAACRGAASVGGMTIGILPGGDPSSANPHVKLALPTGMGSTRNRIVALAGFALISVGGRYGTLSEVAFALDAGRPVIAFGSWSAIPGVIPVETPEGAMEALSHLRRSRS